MSIIEQIKAEIERLHAEHSSRYGTDEAGLVLENLEDFLSTLESEKPMDQDGLEEEIKRYYDDWDGNCRYAQTARHFAKWGAEHLKNKNHV